MTAQDGDKDPKNGQFLPGNRGGPGRPKGVDFRTLITTRLGDTLDDTLVRVFERLVTLALSGDVQAAKLLLDRVCLKDGVQVDAGENFNQILRQALGLEAPSRQ